ICQIFQIKTSVSTGLILYAGTPTKIYLALEIVDGQFRYVYSVGLNVKVVRVNLKYPLSDNRWHLVSVMHPTSVEHILSVDNSTKTDLLTHISLGSHSDHSENMYIGGVPQTFYGSLHRQVC